MLRAVAALFAMISLVPPALAQTQEEGEMRLYIQQLEDRVRQLTGDNEQLAHEVTELRTQLGLPPEQAAPQQTGAVNPMPPADSTVAPGASGPGAPPRDLGSLTVAPNGAPIDLSTLAGGGNGGGGNGAEPLQVPGVADEPGEPQQAPTQTAVIAPQAPTTALTGSARDEYDLAYGYILTGDYGLAEQNFKAWLASFPNDPQVPDAEFWLGESHLQQGEYRDAANAFLAVYKAAPESSKGPDALLKLGISLSALGEKPAACATFTEVGRRYPRAPESVMSHLRDEQKKAGCAG